MAEISMPAKTASFTASSVRCESTEKSESNASTHFNELLHSSITEKKIFAIKMN